MRISLGVVRAVRPKQWLKNVLVLTAPLAAGVIFQAASWPGVAVAFVVFCVASSGVYLVNDLLDVDSDRAHPTKRYRPIASGVVPAALAWPLGVALLLIAPTAAWVLNGWRLALVMTAYEAMQLAYCIWLKHVPVLDLIFVSSGFLLRAVAGGVAVAVVPSQWFLLVTSLGSLFMVAGKRYSEKVAVDQSSGSTRAILEFYSESYLRFVWTIAAGIALVAYALWALELGRSAEFPWAAISILPFGVALLRYAFIVDRGLAGAPEETVLGDRQLLIMGLIWLLSFTAVVATR